jgi:NAD(P)-dependent dehydrogenase (short-subunit alcohol dehydrogenase family)
MNARTARLAHYGPEAVVTGATSGIGRAIAGEPAAVRDELGGEAVTVAADLSTAEGVAAELAATADLRRAARLGGRLRYVGCPRGR